MNSRNKSVLICIISLIVLTALFKSVETLKAKRESFVLPPPVILTEIWLPRGVVFEGGLQLDYAPRAYLSLGDFRQRFPTGGIISLDRTDRNKINVVHEEKGLWYISSAQRVRNPWGGWIGVGEVVVEDDQIILHPRISFCFTLIISLLYFFLVVSFIVFVFTSGLTIKRYF